MERTALSKGRRPAQPKPSRPVRRRITDEDKERAKGAEGMARAMAICGFASGPHLQCPNCGTAKAKKVVIRPEKHYIKCFACGWYKSSIDLIADQMGMDPVKQFLDIVNLINGVTTASLDPEHAKRIAEMAENASKAYSDSFHAELSERTVEVYNAVLSSKHVSLPDAIRYYGQWHITPEAVATVGFVYITEPNELARELLARFGTEVIVASGLARPLEHGDRDTTNTKLRWMFSANYPVVEPQMSPKGLCHSMQFRPSNAQKKKVLAHKAGEGRYVPPFMSLRGAGPEHLIGINLEHLCSIPPTRVDIVEGAKDVAADISLGNEAFGMPGTGVLPPKKTIDALRRAKHTLRVCMDGDAAGVAAQDKVVEHLIANGFPADRITKHKMPAGKDITDILVDRYQRQTR